MNSKTANFPVWYCVTAVVIPGLAWSLVFAFLMHFKLPEAAGTSGFWKIQCGAALLALAMGVRFRDRAAWVTGLSLAFLGFSFLLVVGALLLQLWMLQPMD